MLSKASTTDESSSTDALSGVGVKSLLSRYEQHQQCRRASLEVPPTTTVVASAGGIATMTTSHSAASEPSSGGKVVETAAQQQAAQTTDELAATTQPTRAVKKLPPSIMQMFDRRDSGIGASDLSLCTTTTSGVGSSSSHSRLHNTTSLGLAKSDTANTSSTFNLTADTCFMLADAGDSGSIGAGCFGGGADYSPSNTIMLAVNNVMLSPSPSSSSQQTTIVNIVAEDSLTKSSSLPVGKIAKEIISQYEKKEMSPTPTPQQSGSEQAKNQQRWSKLDVLSIDKVCLLSLTLNSMLHS